MITKRGLAKEALVWYRNNGLEKVAELRRLKRNREAKKISEKVDMLNDMIRELGE